VAARLAVLEDVDITGTEQSSAALLGISVPALTDTLNGHLLRQLLNRSASGGPGPLTPLASQLNHELTRQMLGDQGQDRYAKAVELLDSDKLHVRMGGIYEGYSGGGARFVTNFQLAVRLRERRPASRKDWVTTLSPTETGRACIIPPDSPKTRSSTCARWYMQIRRTATSIRGRRPSAFTSQWS
jgi:hypothetical protein